ncbi:hypothetical protein B0T20DRAFT_392365 [Sordaria brevicollis]|uniref:Uncharacterized protein n=1 Tax=Sordaria brevicollis TaxID=83679 RepID=A0AAE0PG92_SORBR|nr:hypothetical protein B0T20DRAFT_392365 [Sordaria brevicollis]
MSVIAGFNSKFGWCEFWCRELHGPSCMAGKNDACLAPLSATAFSVTRGTICHGRVAPAVDKCTIKSRILNSGGNFDPDKPESVHWYWYFDLPQQPSQTQGDISLNDLKQPLPTDEYRTSTTIPDPPVPESRTIVRHIPMSPTVSEKHAMRPENLHSIGSELIELPICYASIPGTEIWNVYTTLAGRRPDRQSRLGEALRART